MKKLSVLSLLMCVGSLTLAGCNNGSGGGGRTKTSESSGETTSGGTSATSTSSSSGSSSTSGQPGPVYPTDWTAEQKAAMSEKLDSLILPYVPANWSVWNTDAYVFAVRTENLTAAELKVVYDNAQGYTYLGKDSYNREWYGIQTTNGYVEVCVFQQSQTQAAVGCGYYKGTSGAWDAADVTAMESAMFGISLPHPSGVWYGPEVDANNFASFAFTLDDSLTLAGIGQSFKDAGFLAMVDPESESGRWIFSKQAPEQYYEQTIYIVGTIYAGEDYAFAISASASLSPSITDNYSLAVNGTYFHQNDEVALTLTKGTYYPGEDQITISPENAAHQVSAAGGTYVYAIDLEEGTVTFTASNSGKQASVSIQVLDPEVPTDWSAEIKSAMNSKIANHLLPYAPGSWALVEQESFKVKSDVANADVATIVAAFEASGYESSVEEGVYTLVYDDLHGLVTAVVSADEEFVYIEAGYVVHAWSSLERSNMSYILDGTVLPYPLGAWESWWNQPSATTYRIVAHCADARVTLEDVVDAYEADGYLVKYDAAESEYLFCKLSTNGSKFVNGSFFALGTEIYVLAMAENQASLDDTFAIAASSPNVYQGEQVTVTVTVGNYYDEEAEVTFAPEGSVTLVSENDGVYVYEVLADIDTEITFTATLEDAGLHRDVTVTVVDPSVKVAWTAEEVAAMEQLFGEGGYQLPFFGDGWALSYEAGTVAASAEVTGVVSSIIDEILNSSADIFQISSSILVLPATGGVYEFEVYESESATHVEAFFVENEAAWSAADLDVISANLGVASLPFVASVHSSVAWAGAQSFAYAALYNVTALSYAYACMSAGFSVSYGDASSTWFICSADVDATHRLNIQVNPSFNGNGCTLFAYVDEYTESATFPGDTVLAWLRTVLSDAEYAATIVPYEGEGISYAYYMSQGEIRVRIIFEEAQADISAVVSAYNAACVEQGYVQYGTTKFYDSADGRFYYSATALSTTIVELVFMLN